MDQLTKRERQVMALMLEGKSTKIIARELNISPSTTELHRSKVLNKMNCKSIAELILIRNIAVKGGS